MMFRPRPHLAAMMLAGLLLLPGRALAQSFPESEARGWLGVGLGGGTVQSLAPAPSAGREAFAASLEMGYRLNRDWGVGLELGAILPFNGCPQWECGSRPVDFAPNFTRFGGFAEFRPARSGLRLRAGVGVSSFCYRHRWSEDAWSWLDGFAAALFPDVLAYGDGSGAWRCDASRQALGGSVSVGHDWPIDDGSATWGLRLTAEAANYAARPSEDMAPFRHRALMLTLHLTLQ